MCDCKFDSLSVYTMMLCSCACTCTDSIHSLCIEDFSTIVMLIFNNREMAVKVIIFIILLTHNLQLYGTPFTMNIFLLSFSFR